MCYAPSLKKRYHALFTASILFFCLCGYSSYSHADATFSCQENNKESRNTNIDIPTNTKIRIYAGFPYAQPIWEYQQGEITITCINKTNTRKKLAISVEMGKFGAHLKAAMQYGDRELKEGDSHDISADYIEAGDEKTFTLKGFTARFYLIGTVDIPNEPIGISGRHYAFVVGSSDSSHDNFNYTFSINGADNLRTLSCQVSVETNQQDGGNINLGKIKTNDLIDGVIKKDALRVLITKKSCYNQDLTLSAEFIPDPQSIEGDAIILRNTVDKTATGAVLQLMNNGNVVPLNKPFQLAEIPPGGGVATYFSTKVKRGSEKIKLVGGEFSASVVLKISYL